TARALTQQQLAKLAGLPRATWQHLESGAANPTVSVLHKVALALQISVEELISPPRAACRLYSARTLPVKTRGPVPIAHLHLDAHDLLHAPRAALPRPRRAPCPGAGWPSGPAGRRQPGLTSAGAGLTRLGRC